MTLDDLQKGFEKREFSIKSVTPYHVPAVYRPSQKSHIPVGRCPNCKNVIMPNKAHLCAVVLGEPIEYGKSQMDKSEEQPVPQVPKRLLERARSHAGWFNR